MVHGMVVLVMIGASSSRSPQSEMNGSTLLGSNDNVEERERHHVVHRSQTLQRAGVETRVDPYVLLDRRDLHGTRREPLEAMMTGMIEAHPINASIRIWLSSNARCTLRRLLGSWYGCTRNDRCIIVSASTVLRDEWFDTAG